jgi:septal ring factor EnvC (AmiA/AmiB activator)
MTTLSVIEARAQLAQAEADARKERRAALTKQLAELRAELRTKRKTFDKLARRIMQGQADLDNVRGSILAVSDVLSRLLTVKPACADLLPDDPESKEWLENCAVLNVRLDRLRAERQSLPNVELLRNEGVQLRERIQQLEYAESNIVNELEGTLAQDHVGGTFGLT